MKNFKKYINEEEQVLDSLLDFFMKNSNPKDSEVHKFAEKMGMEPDNLEAEIYEILSTFTAGGFAKEKNFTEKDVDEKELKMGIDVEYEHLNKESKYAKELSKRIALDHLAEMPDYYTKLKKMEGDNH